MENEIKELIERYEKIRELKREELRKVPLTAQYREGLLNGVINQLSETIHDLKSILPNS